MSQETCITLPDAATMTERLKSVDDNSHAVQKFYPALAEKAGKELVPMGVVMMLQLTIADYTEGMSTMMVGLLNMNMERYIDALVPDEEAASEVKSFWTEVQQMTSAG